MDEHKSFRENIKDMTWPERAAYFRDYYLIWTVAAIAAVVIAIAIIYSFFHQPAKRMLYAYVISDLFDQNGKEAAVGDLAQRLAVGEEQILLDDGRGTDYEGDIQIATLFADRQIDIVICPRETFVRLAGEGAFIDLEDAFDDAFLDKWKDSMVRAAGYEEQDLSYAEDPFREAGNGVGEETLCGIVISDGGRYKELSLTGEEFLCGIVANSQHTENAASAVMYFMGD